jgi:hypothetical protein
MLVFYDESHAADGHDGIKFQHKEKKACNESQS